MILKYPRLRLSDSVVLERFPAKWKPVRVKKTRQIKNLEPRSDSIGTEKALDFECGQCPCHVIRRCHVDGTKAARPRTFDIGSRVVEEQDPRRRHADRFYHMIIRFRVGFAQTDARRQEYLAEMAEHVGIGLREMRDMGRIGVGESI